MSHLLYLHFLIKSLHCIPPNKLLLFWIFITSHQCPVFTVVTDDCHANTILVGRVTVNCKWRQSLLTVRVDYMSTAQSFWVRILEICA